VAGEKYQTLLKQSQEKRAEHRRKVLKSGVILFNKGYASFSCRVKNISEKGALLDCGNTAGIPTEFDFRMNGEGSAFPARVIWRNRSQVGICLAGS